LNKYVAGETPIPYEEYFAKMGVTEAKLEVPGNPFLKGQMPYITIDPSTKEIKILPSVELNIFMTSLGIKNDDIIKNINGKDYNLDNVYDLVLGSMSWKDGDDITVTIKRDGKEQILKGKVVMPKETKEGYQITDESKAALREAWLKG
jgi:C-terminal processing protease CtpA/Prc